MIPTYQELMRPVLQYAENGEVNIRDAVVALSEKFDLSPEEQAMLNPSGKQTTMANRTHWARSYLKQAGLVKNTRRGWYELTDRGRAALAEPGSTTIDKKYLEQFDEFQDFQSRGSEKVPQPAKEFSVEADDDTPDETLRSALKQLNNTLASELLDQIREADPAFFEALIVDLFVAMGYGKSAAASARALGQSGDNGVDGVIDQDALGVDQIYLQAKRYKAENSIGSGAIRDFFGALNLKRAGKGIFVTTSSFTKSATETAENLSSRIVLIDGPSLADLMIKYGVGCRTEETLHLKKLDIGYFE